MKTKRIIERDKVISVENVQRCYCDRKRDEP